MDSYISKTEAALLLPTPRSLMGERIEAVRLAGGRAHDAALLAGLRGIAVRVRLWFARRHAADELRMLGKRELADIGLTRADIDHVLAEADARTLRGR